MNTNSGMLRLQDIAIRAGVTKMTVSKALRNAPDVAVATRERLQKLAREMGYVPNTAARALKVGQTRLLGVVIPSSTNPVMSRLIMGLEDGAFQLGCELLLSHSLNQAGREEECIRRFLARRVDGIFIAPVYRFALRAPIYQELRDRRIRTVILGQPAPFCLDFCHVTPDDVTGAQRVTQHLIELGHRQIACLAGHPSSPAAQERYEGYQRALREAGLPVNEQFMFSAGATFEDGEKAALQMINENCPATAVVAVNDLVAIGAADVFLRQGRRIPEDISIAGFGNTLLAEHFRVPLTTVRQPKLRLGTAAIETMRRLIAGEVPENRRLPAELEIRASTAAPGRQG